MKVAKMIDNTWVTRRKEKLAGLELLLAQPLDVLTGEAERPPIVATDIIGVGVEETMLMVGGSSTCSTADDMSIPVDAVAVDIMDDQEIDRGVFP